MCVEWGRERCGERGLAVCVWVEWGEVWRERASCMCVGGVGEGERGLAVCVWVEWRERESERASCMCVGGVGKEWRESGV